MTRRSYRDSQLSSQSFFRWYKETKKPAVPGKRVAIPHFKGYTNGTYWPVSEYRAKCLLTVHKPWSIQKPIIPSRGSKRTTYAKIFNYFVKSNQCPADLRLAVERDKHRAKSKATEPTENEAVVDQRIERDKATEDIQTLHRAYTTHASKTTGTVRCRKSSASSAMTLAEANNCKCHPLRAHNRSV